MESGNAPAASLPRSWPQLLACLAAAPRAFPGTGMVRCTHPGHLTSGPATAITASLYPDSAAATLAAAPGLYVPASRSCLLVLGLSLVSHVLVATVLLTVSV